MIQQDLIDILCCPETKQDLALVSETALAEINEKITTKKTDDDNILRTGDRAKVTFEFKYNGEYLKEGFKILLAEGKVKIIGKIISQIE